MRRRRRKGGGVCITNDCWLSWMLKDDGVIILGPSNYIHRHTCHVNANSVTGPEIRSQVMPCLEM